jgi:taurine dioxygenase
VLGVEVRGVDLREPLSEPVVAAILKALSEHLVLVFREQILTPAQQISFMGRLGHLAPSSPVIPGISREHHQVKAVDGRQSEGRVSYWHSDITYMLEPPSTTALFARVLPPSSPRRSPPTSNSAHRCGVSSTRCTPFTTTRASRRTSTSTDPASGRTG